MMIIILFYYVISFSYASELSLEQAYQAALKLNENELRNRSIKGQAVSRYQTARSYLLPELTATGQYLDSREKEEAGNRTQSSQKTMGVNLRQSLFQGGLFSAVEREKASREIADLEVRKNELSLYQQVAHSYYRILLLNSVIEVLKEIDQVSANRVKVIRQRVSIGRSKRSDLLSNELQSQALKIDLGKLTIELEAEKEYLARLTGVSKDVKLVTPMLVPTIKSEEYYVSKLDKTPAILLQKKYLEVAEKDEKIFKSRHLPELYLDLGAKYGEITNNEQGREYTAMLQLEIPLFAGGRTSAEARQASWKRNEERAKYDIVLKDQSVEIKNQYNLLQKNIELFKIYEESLDTARKNYQFFNRELSLGLVSNLELLSSVSDYLTAKKNREEAFFQLKLVEVNLNQLIGEIN